MIIRNAFIGNCLRQCILEINSYFVSLRFRSFLKRVVINHYFIILYTMIYSWMKEWRRVCSVCTITIYTFARVVIFFTVPRVLLFFFLTNFNSFHPCNFVFYNLYWFLSYLGHHAAYNNLEMFFISPKNTVVTERLG